MEDVLPEKQSNFLAALLSPLCQQVRLEIQCLSSLHLVSLVDSLLQAVVDNVFSYNMYLRNPGRGIACGFQSTGNRRIFGKSCDTPADYHGFECS